MSVEKEASAHRTLMLRSFLRQFSYKDIPEDYFECLREGRDPEQLYSLEKYSTQTEAAAKEAWNETLRDDEEFNKELDSRIQAVLDSRDDWILIGGPPCQAYSLVGRARNKGVKGYTPERDARHFLYQEYLRIIAVHRPAVFVMENVKGILSSKVNGNGMFEKIKHDLRKPCDDPDCTYRIFSLVKDAETFADDGDPVFDNRDFVIEAERYGIPQARHRVILLGIRKDICARGIKPSILSEEKKVNIRKILSLPRLRSGISRGCASSAKVGQIGPIIRGHFQGLGLAP
ncbi:MAG: DNA cytosine methyltransferase [Planctomycetes bacterium]|nr:DNA cytosine methyltransferase [Planctomycetota bacterium]